MDLTLEDVLVLVIHIYSLVSERDVLPSDAEDRLKNFIATCLVDDADRLSPELQQFGISFTIINIYKKERHICYNYYICH